MERKVFSKLNAISFATFFAAASLFVFLMFGACSNMEGDAANSQGLDSGELAGVQTLTGSVYCEGVAPQEFGAGQNDSQQDPDSRTLFPTAPTSLTYTVSGTATINGKTVTATGTYNTSTNKYSINLPYATGTNGTTWSVTISAKSGSTVVLSKTQSITVKSRTPAATAFQLEYSTSSSVGTGTIKFTIAYPSAYCNAIKVFLDTDSTGTSLTLSSGSATYTSSALTPSVHAIKIVMYKGATPVYVIQENAYVYSNMVTNKFFGNAPYISSGAVSVTGNQILAMATASAEGGIWLGGTGIVSGSTASDTGDGSKFAPVATLYKAFQIANDLASVDSSKTYTINVQGNVDAGTSSNKTATLNSTAKVLLKGTNSSTYYTISGGSTAGTYKITSSSSSLTCNYLTFNKMGGITVTDSGKMTMNYCKVTNGTSSVQGTAGGITVGSTGATFESTASLTISGCTNSYASTNGGGGGIFCGGTLNLTGTTISGCKATGTSGCGGGIFVSGTSATVTLDGCTIGATSSSTASSTSLCSNYAASKGGGIYIGNSSTTGVTLKNSTNVSYNYAADGGGIYGGDGKLTLAKTTVQRNGTASNGSGGGIYLLKTPIVFSDTTSEISYNTAAGSSTSVCGGGLYISSSMATASTIKGSFYGNISGYYGGAICNASASVTIGTGTSGGVTIGASGKGNSATYGGGVVNKGTLAINAATIQYNNDVQCGGGVYNDSGKSLTIYGSTSISNNKIVKSGTTTTGGGIYNNGGSVYIYGAVRITANSATSDGGGIYSSGTDAALKLGYNSSGTATSWTSSIDANEAGTKGGGVCVTNGIIMMASGTIGGSSSTYTNKAQNGAGLYVATSNKGNTLSGGTITGNEADNYGGGIYNGGALSLTGVSICSNKAVSSGGGIYNTSTSAMLYISGSAKIGGTSSTGNSTTGSSGKGGGIYNAGKMLALGWTIDSSGTESEATWSGSISYNSSSADGGGIYNAGTTSSTFKMRAGSINNNTAASGSNGGGIYCSSSNSSITLGGSAKIPPGTDGSNDIYLYSSAPYIILSSKLTATPVVGLIKSNAEQSQFMTGVQAVTSTSICGDDFTNSVAKFLVKQVRPAIQLRLLVTTNTPTSAIAKLTKDTTMVSIATKTTNGTGITGSPVFISGRTALTIPKMLVSDHEVTQGEYEMYCKYGGTTPSSTYGTGSNYPAYFVSWYDAVVYCNLRSMAEGLPPVYSVGGKTDPSQWTSIVTDSSTGRLCAPVSCSWSVTIDYTKTGWRIPYEAEWEYLARGGNIANSDQYTYSGGNTPTSVAWYDATATDNKTHPVKQKTENALNLYDMSGNVWEWTSDFHISPVLTTTPITGPASPGTGYTGQRVTRGGGYRSDADGCKLSNRYCSAMTYRGDDMGFRIVRTLP